MSNPGSSTGGSTNGVCLPASGDVAEGVPEGPAGPPILDLAVLHRLEDELGGTGVAHRFAEDYIRIWNKRLAYLRRSVDDDDLELAMDAVLSVKNSAFMVGASRLAGLAVSAECLLRTGDLAAVQRLLPGVALAGAEAVNALTRGYLGRAM